MKNLNLLIILLFLTFTTHAQVGINNTNPQATLDITVTDPTAPTNKDGILIPRIDNFPTTNPGANQNGLMVFISGNGAAGSPEKGFYYWDWNTTDSSGEWRSAITKTLNDLEDAKNNNYSIAVGTSALVNLTTGEDNVALGQQALEHCSTCYQNTAVGGFAMAKTRESGSRNTSIGYNSGNKNEGRNNVFLGYNAGERVTTGSENVFIGSQVAQYAPGEISGSIFIGYSAGHRPIGSNQLYIHNGFSPLPLIYGEFNNGLLGINNNEPDASLDIKALNIATPRITDGILIPRFDNFSTTNPGAKQDGMLVFITGNNGTPSKGFYFWDNDATSWQPINTGTTIEKIDDLSDGKSDNDGSSLFLGINAGTNDDGNDNKNIGIGLNSLTTNSNGKFNIALGANTLKDNTSGTFNIAIGNAALSDNITGANNIAIGENSLTNNTSGAGNISLGNNSGYNTTGNSNIFLGASSGYSNITGNNNVFVGNGSGVLNTGSNNVFLGHQAGYNERGSNKLYIDNSNTSSPLIYGEFDDNELNFNAKVGINKVNARYDIHIKQSANTAAGRGGVALENSSNTNTWKLYTGTDSKLYLAYNNANKGSFATDGMYTPSDRRLKTSITLLSAVLPHLKLLKSYTYKYKNQESASKKTVGFMAQDVQNIFPELVQKDYNGYLSLNYAGFGVLAIKAIQEQQAQIETQQTRIDKQDIEIKNLKQQLAKYGNLEQRINALENKTPE